MTEKSRSRYSALFAAVLTVGGLSVMSGLGALLWVPIFGEGWPVPEWFRFFGRLHPVVLHLPIGMLTLVVLMELGRIFRRSSASTLWPMFFTAISAVVAAVFGYLLWQSQPEDYSGELLESHLRLGLVFAGLTVLTVVVKSWVEAAGGRGAPCYWVLLLASGGAMTVASHDGGSITHGKTFLTDEAPEPLKSWMTPPPKATEIPVWSAEEQPHPPKEAQSVVDVKVSYLKHVQPIFDAKCVSCHGPDKAKGKLRMDSYEWLVKGGKEGPAFEPGDEDSNLLFRVHLPLDDEEHMPPEGKKQMTAEEIEWVTSWILGGAEND
ncbi:putative membrane protein/mono/diheme cytochrome c family protein [Haloferula luteola]|uniref:Putative membrane protein/mono/diheme cytochrome c family protein n=1 Tax=Haloferula luteola TaxID=595692 RepID=A0A840V5T8_9BACT|nr:c-type cytochrome domain-containing protein [Haloferula luteola]MBB5353332.1 putative membrane protein/mono/diheme cytochrome c family protein [Haloferula luteola]